MFRRSNASTLLVLLCLLTLAAGCGPVTGPPNDGLTAAEQQQRDIEEYNRVWRKLNEGRTEFMGDVADELRAVDNRLFWLEFRTFDPSVHSFDATAESETNYDFSIGSGDKYNYKSSSELVVTAKPKGEDVIYRAYEVGKKESLVGERRMEAPKDEQRWWAYAIDGDEVYLVKTEEKTNLYRWKPGNAPQKVVALEEASGAMVGEFWAFAVFNETMVYVESGRVWLMDLQKKEAQWLENETEVRGGYLTEYGILFSEAEGGMRFLDLEAREMIDVGKAIREADYRLNETFSAAHLPNGEDYFLYKDWVVYTANSGLFAYELRQGTVTPLLLEPRIGDTSDVRIVYRNPVVLENGMLFTVGLTSESGSVGADGPVYMLDFRQQLDQAAE